MVMTPVPVVMVMTPVPACRWANVTVVIRVMTPVTVVRVMTPVSVCRRASVSSLIRLRAASMHVPSSASSSFLRRDSTMLRRDSTLHSFMMSEKSRTTLSAKLRSKLQICLLYQNE